MRQSRPFTLIELLTVMAIIAILIAILLPTLGRAKQTANAAVCLNNLKQTATWAMLYADDWDAVLPVNGKGGYEKVTGINWYSMIGKGRHGMLRCPTARSNLLPRSTSGSEKYKDFSLSMRYGGGTSKVDPPVPMIRDLSADYYWFGDGHASWGGGAMQIWGGMSKEGGNWEPWMWQTEVFKSKYMFYGKGHPRNTANFVFGDGHAEPMEHEQWF